MTGAREPRAVFEARLREGKKKCPGCSLVKDLTEFYASASSTSGRQTRCKECARSYATDHKAETSAYNKEWWEKNKDREKAIRKAWYEKNKAATLAKQKAYRELNPEKVRAAIARSPSQSKEAVAARSKKWQQANRERARERGRRWQAKHPLDPVITAAKNKAWRAANPDKCREIGRNKRARKRNAEGSHTKEEIATLFVTQRGKCANASCGTSIKAGYHVDHIMPLILGGSNYIRNIQLLCKPCNLRKHKKHPIKWAQANGRLL